MQLLWPHAGILGADPESIATEEREKVEEEKSEEAEPREPKEEPGD